MLLAADQLYRDTDFIFQQDVAPAHSAKTTSTCFKDHAIPVLNWPAHTPDHNPIENLRGIVKSHMHRENMQTPHRKTRAKIRTPNLAERR